MAIKAVIFDLDGTLLDTCNDLANSVNYALDKNGFPTHNPEMFKIFTGDGTDVMITRALPESNRDAETLKKVREDYFEYYNEHSGECTRPYDGIPELLKSLKERGIMLAVTSNKIEFMTQSVIKHYFGDTFDFVTGQSENVPPKPNPLMVFNAMKSLNVEPSECLYVGDTGVDAKTGKNAGIITVGVQWGFREREELIENGADAVIDKPCQILEFI